MWQHTSFRTNKLQQILLLKNTDSRSQPPQSLSHWHQPGDTKDFNSASLPHHLNISHAQMEDFRNTYISSNIANFSYHKMPRKCPIQRRDNVDYMGDGPFVGGWMPTKIMKYFEVQNLRT